MIQDEKEDEDMENEEATAFIQEVYMRVTPTMEKIKSYMVAITLWQKPFVVQRLHL